MKRTFLLGLAFCALGAFAQANLSSGIDLKNLDTSIKPGNDFYHYAAGGWLKSHPLDAEHAENGAFVDLQELNQKRIQGIILEYASKPQQKGSLGQKIGSLYNLMMDSVRLNREGWAPIKPTLDKIAAIKNRKEYQLVCAQLDRNGEGTMMFGIGVGADQKDAEWNLVGIGQGGLGLGERDYYVSDDPQNKRVLEAYKQYLKKLFMLTGADEATAQKKMEAVLAIETRIAKVSYDQVKLRDIDANYHKMSYTQLVNDFPGIDWGNVFLASGFPAFDYIDVGQPEPIHEVEKILTDTPLEDLKTYAEAKVISGATGQLSDEFRKTAFALSQVTDRCQAGPSALEARCGSCERHTRRGYRQALCGQVFPGIEQAAYARARA
jgi:putative endopeptidase